MKYSTQEDKPTLNSQWCMFKCNFLHFGVLCTGLLWRLVDEFLRDTQIDYTLRVVANIAQSVISLETDYRKTRRRELQLSAKVYIPFGQSEEDRHFIYTNKTNVQADLLTAYMEDCGFHTSKTAHLAWFACEFAVHFTQRYELQVGVSAHRFILYLQFNLLQCESHIILITKH